MKLPYKFNDKDRKIIFDRHDLPAPWINYLSNGKMHAFISQAGGGLTWWLSPQNFRITRYRFYNLPIDSPGFYIYIRMKDGCIWSPTFRPCETKLDKWQAEHSTGYSSFFAEKDGLKATLTFFMATDFDTLIWDLKLVNNNDVEIECDVYAYVEFSQFMYQNEVNLGYYLKWNVQSYFDKDLNSIIYRYNAWMHPRIKDCPLVYFSTNEEIFSYCCDRDLFCGFYRDERNPIQIERGKLNNDDLNGGEACGALHSHLVLNAKKEKRINYYLGVSEGALVDFKKAKENTKKALSILKTKGETDKQYSKNIEWWNNHLDILQCEIPDKDAERQINTWNPIQSVVTARFSRSISATASGIRGIGFRDTCQDMLAQAYRKPAWATEMLCYLASQQFEDGHSVHTAWPEDRKLPQDIVRSDNHIWMSYLTYAIVAETGDLSILEKKVAFLDKDLKTQVNEATIWEHLMRGVEFTENHKGEHGFPLILFSDWNDHLGPFGRKGKGESIFVSQQHIYSLRLLSELAEMRGETDKIEKFKKFIKLQEEALEKYAWDGEWFYRGYDDEGQPIGSKKSNNARIWVNPQSWMVIANACGKKKQIEAMDSAKHYLGTDFGLLINTPGFPLTDDILHHKVNGLPAGYSENAGVFCQANCWAIMAEALLGRGNIAWEYYKQIIPNEVIKKIGIEKYRGEPYAYSSTLLGDENKKNGQSCVSQVTGTAAWMDVVSTQYLLGIRPVIKGLLIDPCIPSDWKGFAVKRIFRGCELDIQVENLNGSQKGVKELYFNGNSIDITKGAILTSEIISNITKATVKVIM